MSDQAQNSNQQTIVIGLAVIAVLLAAIVGVLIYQTAQAAKLPEPTVTAPTTPPATDPAATTPGQMPPATDANATPVDPKTATKLPAGTEPEAWVTAYYEACDKGDFKAAYDHLPADKKAGQTPDGLKEQLNGYGIKGFKIVSATAKGSEATVIADQITGQYGTFTNTWTFEKKDGVWIVKSKAVTGMK